MRNDKRVPIIGTRNINISILSSTKFLYGGQISIRIEFDKEVETWDTL
jgi:hypothetical protein